MNYKLLKLLRAMKLLKLHLPSRVYKLISDGGRVDIVRFCSSAINVEKKMYVVVALISYFAGNTEGNHQPLSYRDS
jgi:hypothetical protein